jgi:MoxR-like ATPase
MRGPFGFAIISKGVNLMTNGSNPAREAIKILGEEVQHSIIGQEYVVERLIIALLANGNVLVEGLPGLAKTRSIKSIAKVLEAGLSRIQFTPDLLPSDITGTEVYYTADGKGEFRFQPGPIFNNLILADEINRAPAKVQAALLEAMEERQVTVAGKTYKLPDLFMVMATQNPIEQEGTYPLPEAQMDRFLMHVYINYPNEASEIEVIRLVRGEEGGKGVPKKEQGKVAIAQQLIFDARSQIYGIHVSEAIEKYIMDLVTATRQPERYGEDLKKWIHIGASPRGGIGLDKCSRVHAWLKGRDYVTPDDVRAVVNDVFRHRILLSYEANAEGVTGDQVIQEIVKRVAVA